MKINENHLLAGEDNKPVRFQKTPNGGDKLDAKFLVIHYTASMDLDSTVRWLADPRAKASSHLVIDRDGAIVQMMPFDKITWHAGRSAWKEFSGLNQFSIGIELVNAGKLMKQGNSWRSWFGKDYPDNEVIEAIHKNEKMAVGWHLFTPQQIQAAFDAVLVIMDKYQIEEILGHDEIAPGRKSDPGPAFPMENFRGKLMGRESFSEQQYTVTTNLNIRSGPDVAHIKVTEKPLPKGAKVEILENFGEWCYINVLDVHEGDTDIQGWVFGKYLKKVQDEMVARSLENAPLKDGAFLFLGEQKARYVEKIISQLTLP